MADQIGHLPEAGNLAVLDGEPGVLQHARLRHLRALLPQHALRHDAYEFSYVLDDHIRNVSVIPSEAKESISTLHLGPSILD